MRSEIQACCLKGYTMYSQQNRRYCFAFAGEREGERRGARLTRDGIRT